MYEQGVYPSRFNPDHKWTFTIQKPQGASWSPRSINLLEMLIPLSGVLEIERIQRVQEFFDDTLHGRDQTLMPNVECAIELVLRKRGAAGAIMGDVRPAAAEAPRPCCRARAPEPGASMRPPAARR